VPSGSLNIGSSFGAVANNVEIRSGDTSCG
jgi:hypothetical protein